MLLSKFLDMRMLSGAEVIIPLNCQGTVCIFNHLAVSIEKPKSVKVDPEFI
jgi:hypothetical protein